MASLSMAGRALSRRAVKDLNTPAVDLPALGMAKPARHFFMRASQRKGSAAIMVELYGCPTRRSMARRTVYRVTAMPELSRMDVLMATLATLGRRLKADLPHPALRIAWPVTIPAAQNRVRSFQWKTSRRVIERFQFLPGPHHVAEFAEILPGLQVGFHRGREFPGMRIAVATLAALVRKAELPVPPGWTAFLSVTILASHCRVSALQHEGRRLMLGKRIERRMEALHVVAIFASIKVRSRGELSPVRIAVAIQALPE
jgi:hypothetical protein